MRTMMRGKHGKKSRFPALAALALCAVLIVTFMPNLMFSANAEESQPNNANTAVVQSFNTPDESTLEADTESSAQDLVNSKYPSLKGTVRRGDTEKSDVSVPVTWKQDTEKSDDSHYVFQAELKDTNGEDTDNDGVIYSLNDSNMTLPEVSVKKSEKKDANVANSNQDNGQSSKCKSDNTDNTRDQYSYEDKYIKVSARLTDAEAISDHAELKVNAINKDTKKYAAYLHKLNASEKSKYVNCLLYDISFIENGKEVEPDSGHVQLQVKFKNRQLTKQLGVESADDLSVIHFINDDSSKKHMQTLKSNTKLHNQTVSFSTTSFSTFAFKSDEGQKNTWLGSDDITFDQVQSALQGTDNFAVYANKLIQGIHLEGNVKVGVLDAVDSGALVNQDDSVISRNKIASIKVVKNVSPALHQDQTFNFGIYKKENNQYTQVGKSISVDIKQGETSGSSEITDKDVINEINDDTLHTYYIFELNDDQSPIVGSSTATIGGKQFNVSYQGNEIVPPGNASNFTNYIGSISNGNNTTANLEMQYFYDADYNRMTYIEDFENPRQEGTHLKFESARTTVDIANYYNKFNENKFYNIQQQSGIKEDINNKLNALKTFSSTLANAENGAKSGEGALSVINLKSTTGKLSTDLDNANFKSVVNGEGIKDTINNGEYLLINIDVGSRTEYKLDKIMIDGNEPDNNNEELARHVILNFVKSNDSGGFTAYDGKISFDNVSAGLLLAPAANVYQEGGGFRGQVIANTFDRTQGSETHKNVITKSVNRVVAVSNSPVGSEINKINLTVNKVWKNENGHVIDPPAGSEVQVQLMKKVGDQEPVAVENQLVTLKDGAWEHTFTDLPTKDDQKHPITYSVKEISINGKNVDEAGYTSAVSKNGDGSFTITNTKNNTTPETTSVSVKKVWNDENGRIIIPPAGSEVQVQLMKKVGDQEPVAVENQLVTLKDGAWEHTFTNLPMKNDQGNPITYSVKEISINEESVDANNQASGYTSAVSNNGDGSFTITNTKNTTTPETTSVSVKKVWKDENGENIIPSDSSEVQIQLMKKVGDQEPVAVDNQLVTLKDGAWEHTFTNLPTKNDQGNPITYSVKEISINGESVDANNQASGYTSTVSKNNDGSFTVTNTENTTTPETTSVSVKKVWNDYNNQDGKRPESITLRLYADGTEVTSKAQTISGTSDTWSYSFTDLPKNNKDGKEINYTVKEDPVDGYKSSGDATKENGFTITNTENTTPPTPNPQPTYTTYTVHKVWDLGSGETVPDSVQMQLYKNGEAYGSPVTVTRASGWTYTWTVLPQTENGKLNTWSVKEVDPDNQYTATVVNGASSATVTNRSNNNAGGKTQVSVHKVWKLDNGRTAASSVQAQLYRNGEAYGDPVTLSAGNSWSHIWTGLTKTDAQGNTISWTVREVNVPSGFTSTVTGTDRSFTITNDDKPKDNHNKNNKPVNPNNNNNKPVTPNTNNKKNTPVNPGTPSIPKNTGTVVNRGTSAGTPRTGDQTSLGFWLAMLTAGAAGTAAAVLLKRRKSADEDRD